MYRATLTQRYKVKYPICNAGMAHIASSRLAVAVSRAGGIGVIGVGFLPLDYIMDSYIEAKQQSEGPIGLDFITPLFTPAHLSMLLKLKPDLVVFCEGFPDGETIKLLQSVNVDVWLVANTFEQAFECKQLKANAIIVQGKSAGGFNQAERECWELLPHIREKLGNVILLAAGGIYNGETCSRALRSGADGIWSGTRFLASAEAAALPAHKNAIVNAVAGSTIVTNVFGAELPGRSIRVLKNRATIDHVTKILPVQASIVVGTTRLGSTIRHLPKHSAIFPDNSTDADFEELALPAGVCAKSINEIKTVSEIMAEFVSGLLV